MLNVESHLFEGEFCILVKPYVGTTAALLCLECWPQLAVGIVTARRKSPYTNLVSERIRVIGGARIFSHGIGFDEEFSERIFKIFQRLHGKAEYKGSGIGLAICKKIVDNHEGVIYAEGKLGQGARFIVLLPEKQYN